MSGHSASTWCHAEPAPIAGSSLVPPDYRLEFLLPVVRRSSKNSCLLDGWGPPTESSWRKLVGGPSEARVGAPTRLESRGDLSRAKPASNVTFITSLLVVLTAHATISPT